MIYCEHSRERIATAVYSRVSLTEYSNPEVEIKDTAKKHAGLIVKENLNINKLEHAMAMKLYCYKRL